MIALCVGFVQLHWTRKNHDFLHNSQTQFRLAFSIGFSLHCETFPLLCYSVPGRKWILCGCCGLFFYCLRRVMRITCIVYSVNNISITNIATNNNINRDYYHSLWSRLRWSIWYASDIHRTWFETFLIQLQTTTTTITLTQRDNDENWAKLRLECYWPREKEREREEKR